MSSKITYDQCLCCGSADISKALDCKDYTVSHQTFEVWECRACTFRFTQNVPGASDIGPFYQSAEYISHSDTKEGIVNRLYHIVRNFTLKSKRNLLQSVTGLKQGKLLDIGAGTGAFAHTMKQSGWDVTALEPDETARQNALVSYGLELLPPDVLFTLPGQSFDSITMWHVLEHVHDLKGYLQKFKEILKPGGRLIIAVPNHTSYDAKVYEQYWAAYDVPRHLYHFSPKSMEPLLAQFGFTIEKMKPMWFDSFYVSMLSEKYQYGSANYAKAIWIGLLSNFRTLFNTGKCSSVIYVIRQK